ncbi:NAD-dependent epimerase/dehydratase family protein [Chloroflexota bacterium]
MAGVLIFITGGTGFLGRHLVPLLVENEYRIRLLVRSTSEINWLPSQGVELIEGNVTDPQVVAEGMAGCRYVVHAAGHFRFWGPEEIFERVNLTGTRHVIGAALAHGIERMVHISTVVVVGDPRPGEVIDEESICNPQDSYQRTKLAAERYVREMVETAGLPAIIMRPGAFYGPFGRYAFNRLFIEEPMFGWRVKVEGGLRLTFPVFVPDVAKTIMGALRQGRVGEIYNISDRSITHNRLNDIVSEMLGISKWRLNTPRQVMIFLAAMQEGLAKIIGKEPFYPLNLRHYVFNDWEISSEKARKELNFSPTPIEEGLYQTVEWYLQEREKKL